MPSPFINQFKITFPQKPFTLTDEYYAYAEGRLFSQWITGRGFTTSDIIRNPAYVCESLFRDEIYTERDLSVTTKISRNVLTCTLLTNTTNDFYNGAYLCNVTQNFTEVVTDYVGATKEITVAGTQAAIAEGDKFYLTNINAGVNTASFDAIGSATGTRKDWLFERYINEEIDSNSLISSLCSESHCILHKSYNQKKLITLDSGATVGTFSNPLKQGSKVLMGVNYTPLDLVYTEFLLNYGYDFSRNSYTEKLIVNKGSATVSSLNTYKALCLNAENNYKVKRKFEFNADWIYDESTAVLFLQKLILWFTQQKMIVGYQGDVKNHIKYEVGDKVLINYSYLTPTSKNNSAVFMVTEKTIMPIKGSPRVKFTLLELPEAI